MQVLGARGSELERSFSYGVVRQLFEPFLASLPAQERAELLAGAAGLAAPLFDPVELAAEPAADTSLATLHGLYWLTANVAARARCCSRSTTCTGAIYSPCAGWPILPRMEGLDVWVVVGLRPGEPGADPGLLGQIVSDPLATVVQPAPLSPAAAARLLRETSARCRRRLLRRLPPGDGRQPAAPARARARDRRRGPGPDRGERAPPARARGAGRLAHRLAAPFPPRAGGDEAGAGGGDPGRRRRSPAGGRARRPGRPGRLEAARRARPG